MSLVSDLTVLEELTSNAKQIQDDVLTEILKVNANTEYLQQFLHGSSDKELFKKNVPVVSYEDVKPYIDRVANGEPYHIISGKPITIFLLSSGTSSGNPKIYPMNNIYFEKARFVSALSRLLVSKHIHGVEQGKVMRFLFCAPQSTVPCGLPLGTVVGSLIRSANLSNSNWTKNDTSPGQVILCSDPKQSMYCHLLCGLVQRNRVTSMYASFASLMVQAIHFLENYWKEMSSNIRSGHLSDWITDLSCRDSVSIILGEPNPELADLVERECGQKSWQGIISRLWPNTKIIDAIITGNMAQYIPMLEFYSNKLPLVSAIYGSSETFFGINVNPLCNPQDVSYTFLPNLSYFEFVDVDLDGGTTAEILDLVDVKLGRYYEPLVTNFSGLHRCRVGDVLQVTGFYNNTPQFRYVRRKNMVISVHRESTSEAELLNVLNHATVFLESSNLMFTGFTCYADVSAPPGHYVFYLELKAKVKNSNVLILLDNKVLVECCCVMEEALNVLYRTYRSKDSEFIGPLEIRVVQQGTFDSLMDFFVSRGSSITQYKTPICIKSPEALQVLEDKVLARFFSDRSPTM